MLSYLIDFIILLNPAYACPGAGDSSIQTLAMTDIGN